MAGGVEHGGSGCHRSRGVVEHDAEPVTRGLHLAATEARDLGSHGLVGSANKARHGAVPPALDVKNA